MKGKSVLLLDIDGLTLVVFGFFLFVFCFLLVLYALYSFWIFPSRVARCPYTKKPLRYGEDVKLPSVEKIMRFLHYDVGGYENRVFSMKKAMVCRETGRIFQDCINLFGHPAIDWTFLQKRHPGTWISWGSLREFQKEEIFHVHREIEGFQLERSCPHPAPRNITEEYIYEKPGPLYVDLKTKTLLGWKSVPGTIFEVLVVQKPAGKKKSKDTIIPKSRK